VVSALSREYPELKADLVFDDAVHDLVDEGLDIALRLNTLAASSYIMRRLASVPEVIVGSPVLLDQLLHREGPVRLGSAPWIAHTALRPRSTWTFRSEQGEKVQIRVDVRATANTVVAVRDLLLAGAGFAVLPLHMVRDDLRAGRLEQACPGWTHRKLTLHAVLPTRRPPPRVRAFLAGLLSEIRTLGFDGA
jgi:DNA-binding transcriptional LysR family regulator